MPATPGSNALDDALAWLAGERGAMEALLAELVERSSFTRDPAGVARAAAVAEAALARAGLAVERLAAPAPLQAAASPVASPAPSPAAAGPVVSRAPPPVAASHVASPAPAPAAASPVESATGGARFGPHLAFRGPAPGPPIFLVGHLDTVFPADVFSGFRKDGDRGLGPGAYDMKGGVVVMAFALAAAQRAGLLARVPVAGMLVADEEVGSPESQPLLRERARGAACALVFESGRAGDLVVTRRKGVASLAVEAHGVAAHAGNEPEKGRSAIWSLARFVDRAQALADPTRGLGVNVGTIRGGTSKNTVPERAACEVDLRFETAADGRALAERIREAARDAAIPGTRLEVGPGAWRDPLERTAASAALAAEYGACQRACGLGAGEAPLVGGGSDACTTGAAGVPSIDGLGPRGRGYHTPAEEVDLASLVPKAQALVRFLAGRAGG